MQKIVESKTPARGKDQKIEEPTRFDKDLIEANESMTSVTKQWGVIKQLIFLSKSWCLFKKRHSGRVINGWGQHNYIKH